jgi:molybdenum cofactor biosynthesis enzyme MoaA
MADRAINYETSLPVALVLGDALLSVLELSEGEDVMAGREARDIAYGSKAHDFLNALNKGITSGSLDEAGRACFKYLNALAGCNVCCKELGIRLRVLPNPDEYIVYSLLRQVCACCFSRPESQKAFLLSICAALDVKSALYAYAALAKIELDSGNIESAYAFAQKAAEIEDYPLYISHLYCDIHAAAQKAQVNLDIPFNVGDLSEYFCPVPFDNYNIAQFDFAKKTFSVDVCESSVWSPLGVDGSKGYNSTAHQKMRMSVHDGSYRYCNRLSCPIIHNNLLARKTDVTDSRHKEMIANQQTVVSGVRQFKFDYDNTCNLKCPSCRNDFFHYSPEEIEVLDCFAETEILPLMKTATNLWANGRGEALASRHTLTLLRKLTPAEHPELKIRLFTNGGLDLERAWQELGETASLIDEIYISIDGADQQTFEKLRYPAKWDKLMANMTFLAGLVTAGELAKLSVRYVVQKDNYKQMMDMLRLCAVWQAANIAFIKIRKFNMPDEEFKEKNVFAKEHPLHDDLSNEVARLKQKALSAPLEVQLIGIGW